MNRGTIVDSQAISRGSSRVLLVAGKPCLCFVTFLFLCGSSVYAAPLPFSVTESAQYLIVARKSINGQVTLTTDNFELGANKAPVPSTDNFLDGGSSGGPSLAGNVPALPLSGIMPVAQGVGGNGNLAVTDPDGYLNLQDVGVYADPAVGIRLAAPSQSFNQTSNSFFNDPQMFPNTFNIGTQTGVSVNPNDADQNTRIDPTGGGHPSANVGVTFGYDHSALDAELAAARTAISGLGATGTLNVSGNGGKISTHTTFTAGPGLNVIDIVTGGNDFLVENSNFVIDGPAGAFVIFRLPGNDNMLISNANILVGDGGIGHQNVLFFTDQLENDTHFNFSNTIINGMAFWSLGSSDIAEINIDNAQGCLQLIAEDINLNDVRFMRCSFGIPEPSSVVLACLSVIGFLGYARRSPDCR